MTDNEKEALCEQLESWGLLRRDDFNRWRTTPQGSVAGSMLFAMALWETVVKPEAPKLS